MENPQEHSARTHPEEFAAALKRQVLDLSAKQGKFVPKTLEDARRAIEILTEDISGQLDTPLKRLQLIQGYFAMLWVEKYAQAAAENLKAEQEATKRAEKREWWNRLFFGCMAGGAAAEIIRLVWDVCRHG